MNCHASMWRTILSLVFLTLAAPPSPAQQASFDVLLLPDSLLRKDVLHTEQALDLVQALVVDSVVDKAKQRLKGLGGWIAQRAAARYWVYYTDHKQKYVGSSSRAYKIYDGMGDEVDINVFIMPHLPHYISMARAGFEEARKRPRGDHGFRMESPDQYPSQQVFPLPEALKVDDLGYLTVECEVTPPQSFAQVLQDMFLPTQKGAYRLDTIPNFGTQYPSFGMTGVWCMDCNHNCRPEIHPIEWLWWLDLSEGRPGSSQAKSWMVSLMVDGSNRFHDWTPSPIAGEIALPFAVPLHQTTLSVTLEHIASDPMPPRSGFPDIPPQAFHTSDTTLDVVVGTQAPPPFRATVQVSGGWPEAETRYWISDVHKIPSGYAGYLHVATSVKGLMAFRLTYDYPESRF